MIMNILFDYDSILMFQVFQEPIRPVLFINEQDQAICSIKESQNGKRED